MLNFKRNSVNTLYFGIINNNPYHQDKKFEIIAYYTFATANQHLND